MWRTWIRRVCYLVRDLAGRLVAMITAMPVGSLLVPTLRSDTWSGGGSGTYLARYEVTGQ
jgi:hypothetical protein